MKPTIIFFAGSTAAGKTQLAYYLSEQFYLPIFSTDAVRYDTKVYKDVIDIHDALDDYETAYEWRLNPLLERGKSFIYDGSVDRKWVRLKERVEAAGFGWVLISFDVSRQRIDRNRKMFDNIENDDLFEKWIDDHKKFEADYGSDAQVHITDDNYAQRYDLATQAIKGVLSQDGN